MLSEQETEDFELYIADPHEGFVESLLTQFETDPYVSEPVRKTVKIDGKRVRAIIYRLASGLKKAKLSECSEDSASRAGILTQPNA